MVGIKQVARCLCASPFAWLLKCLLPQEQLGGPLAWQLNQQSMSGLQEWIPDNVWLDIVALSATDALRDLPDSVTRSDAAWHAWYDNEAPERAVIPDFQTRISKFTRMCIVKVNLPSPQGPVLLPSCLTVPSVICACPRRSHPLGMQGSCSLCVCTAQV